MRQLDLFQPVEDIKPQSDPAKDKVNGGMNTVPMQPPKSSPALNEPEPIRVVESKEEVKKEKSQLIQKETTLNGKRGRKSFQKKYYAISEVAKWFHVNASLLRYWENEFDVLKPRKTRKGDRLFRPEDIKNLHLIYYLLRQRKFSIEGAKQYLKENKQKADAQMVLIQSLTKFRSFL